MDNGNSIPREYSNILNQIVEDRELPSKCPDCGSKKIFHAMGGTRKEGDPFIDFMCENCLNEWGIEKDKPLKLAFDLVPQQLFGRNLRRSIPRSKWDKIRFKAYEDANYICPLCHTKCTEKGQIHADEEWEIELDNEYKPTYVLKNIRAICRDCHNIKHMGRVIHEVATGNYKFDIIKKLANHYSKVNKVSLNIFKNHFKCAYDTWLLENHRKEWNIDFGKWKHINNN